jgi:hypothetical protein
VEPLPELWRIEDVEVDGAVGKSAGGRRNGRDLGVRDDGPLNGAEFAGDRPRPRAHRLNCGIAGRPLGCGEVAADPVAVPLMLGLGVEELSVGPYSVPVVKQTVRGLSMSLSRDLARRALDRPSAAEVRALIT